MAVYDRTRIAAWILMLGILLFSASNAKGEVASSRLYVCLYDYGMLGCGAEAQGEDQVLTESVIPLIKAHSVSSHWISTFVLPAGGLLRLKEVDSTAFLLLHQLASEGRIELVVPGYVSHPLGVYPGGDFKRNIREGKVVARRLGIKTSSLFVPSGGRWSPALPKAAAGSFSALVVEATAAGLDSGGPPLISVGYEGTEVEVFLAGADVTTPDLEVIWVWRGRGELVNTDDTVRFDSAKQDRHTERLNSLSENGYRAVTVSRALKVVRDSDVETGEVSFQPDDAGQWGWPRPEWNAGRSGMATAVVYELRDYVLVLQTLCDQARLPVGASARYRRTAEDLWRDLLVLEAQAAASAGGDTAGLEKICKLTEARLKNAIRSIHVEEKYPREVYRLDTRSGVRFPARRGSDRPGALAGYRLVEATSEELGLAIRFSGTPEVRIRRIDERTTDLLVSLEPVEGGCDIRFPVMGESLICSPALADGDRVTLNAEGLGNPVLPLVNGWVYLGDNRNLIKNPRQRHSAARWDVEQGTLVFREEAPAEPKVTWQFLLFRGTAEEGHSLADRLNVQPSLIIDLRGEEVRVAALLDGEQVWTAPRQLKPR